MKSTVYKRITLTVIIITLFAAVSGQTQNNRYQLNWPSDSVIFRPQTAASSSDFFPRFQPNIFGPLPTVYLKFAVSNLNNSVRITIEGSSTALLARDEKATSIIQTDLQLRYHTVTENKQNYLLVSFLPIFKDANGSLRKVDDFKLDLTSIKENSTLSISTKSYQNNSVLASGNWYKIAIAEEGIYKVDYHFLKKLGIDVDQIDPRNIRLFGNGGFALPQKNSEVRPDDLIENAIEVIGESDGKLNADDYLLFYSPGSTKWTINSQQQFEHEKNIYSDSAYYFINIGSKPGLRITQVLSPPQAANYISTNYDDYQLYENDLYSLVTANIKSGRNWYGEDFEFNTTRSFEFNTSGLNEESLVSVSAKMAVRASVSSSARVSVNDQNLFVLTANSVPLAVGADYAAITEASGSTKNLKDGNLKVEITYNKPNSTANAWLDFIELNCQRNYNNYTGYLRFRDKNSVGVNNITQFKIAGISLNDRIWDVTNHLKPQSQKTTVGASNGFTSLTPTLKEFVAFRLSSTKQPTIVGKVANQNLHGLSQADFLIVTAPTFFNEAKRLAEFRKTTQGLSYHVVTTDEVFNEFSSGGRDATAIRDFVKMFYDRAGNNPNVSPKYLLLFGKGSFDNRNIKFNNNNFVVTYQSRNSVSPTLSYTSDDYFGLLDNNEGEFPEDYGTNPGLLDIAIGRIPAKNLADAKNVVDKLIAYESAASFGDWRTNVTIVADDEDNNIHLDQAEANATLIHQNRPQFNIDKIYLDAFQQENTAGGASYPKAKEAISQKINTGTFLINYTGHGGESGWAQERVLTLNDISTWQNPNNLSVIFTATCSFSRWDDPEIVSGGELTLLKENSGAPSIFSTTRTVFSSYNFDLNQSFLKALFNPSNIGKRVTFGEIFKAAKNNNVGGLNINSRNFTLLGDPTALFPIPINGVTTTTTPDTLKAGQKVTIKGFVNDKNGQIINQFNGIIYPTVYDKPTAITTLGQDLGNNGSYPQTFNVQKNILFRGKATVNNGLFSFDFIVPRDINLNIGTGKVSYYATNNLTDASGFNSDLKIGSITSNPLNDKTGPIVKVYLNNENFVSGGITNSSPLLLVNLEDESGINTTGIGIGHDIVATLSTLNRNDKNIILNSYYQSNLDAYQSGKVKYQFEQLPPGLYTLKVKAWDIFNNSTEQIISFEVKTSEKLILSHVLNYPNPFSNRTSFQFEHNYPNETLDVQINIKTVTGRLIKTINQTIFSTGNRVNNIFWDARDDFGEKVARGVYIYELKISSTQNNLIAKKTQKLLIL